MGEFNNINWETKEYICQCCFNKNKNIKALQLHLVTKHGYNKDDLKKYYDLYLKKDGEGICKYSGKPTNYINLNKGYEEYCHEIKKQSRLPTQILYWVIQYKKSEEEAKKIVSDLQTARGNKNKLKTEQENREGSILCNEFWIKRFNFKEEQATTLVSMIQSFFTSRKTPEQNKLSGMTLTNMVNKHGEEEGTIRYNDWHQKTKNRTQVSPSNISKIETTFCHMIELNGFRGKWGKNQLSLFDSEFNNGKTWHYDFSYRNRIIEFFGEYYHGRNKETTDVIRGGKTVGEIREDDKRRIDFAIECGYNVMVIWEDDFRKNPQQEIDKAVAFLKEIKI
jgi:hypothetical protein